MLYVFVAAAMIVATAVDWQAHVIPELDAEAVACTTYTTYQNCAGFNDNCSSCHEGFYPPHCLPCPGLVDRTDDETPDFVGAACSGILFVVRRALSGEVVSVLHNVSVVGHGQCQFDGSCNCTLGTGYHGTACNLNEEDVSFCEIMRCAWSSCFAERPYFCFHAATLWPCRLCSLMCSFLSISLSSALLAFSYFFTRFVWERLLNYVEMMPSQLR